MLLSLALAFLCAMILGWVMQRLHLPALLGMLLTGVLLGSYAANLLDASILGISSQLRQIALIIVLTRAGLGMDFGALKRVGRPAVLLCFVPACFEIAGTVLLAPVLLGLSVVESAVLGAVIAAVSPAVVVPKMLRLTQEKRGTDKGIPQLIMAGASVDDVFVIVLFTAFTDMAAGQNFSVQQLLRIPTSILLGVAAGTLCGLALAAFFTARHMRDSVKVLILLSVSFLLVSAEAYFTGAVGFSGLIAIVVYAAVLGRKVPAASARLSAKYAKLWVAAEPLLFVLIGAAVNPAAAWKTGAAAVLLIAGALVIRMMGVWVSMLKTPLSGKERLFCMAAYTPKATVQAAIGGIPLAMGLACGDTVLSVAVLAIFLTAPLGAFAIDALAPRLLHCDAQQETQDVPSIGTAQNNHP